MNILKKLIKSIRDYSPWAPHDVILEQQRKVVASDRRRDRLLLSKRGLKLPFSGYPLPLAGDSSTKRLENILLNKLLFWWTLAFVFLFAIAARFLFGPEDIKLFSSITALSMLVAARQTVVWWPKLRQMRQGIHGERLIAEYLNNAFRDNIEGTVRVYHDIPDRIGNFDHVVICRKGLFLINTKTMTIRKDSDKTLTYQGNSLSFKNSGKPLPYNPVSQVHKETKRLRELLRECHARYDHGQTNYKEPAIRGVALFPGWQVEENGATSPVWVMKPQDLSDRIAEEDTVMDDTEVKHYGAILSKWAREIEEKTLSPNVKTDSFRLISFDEGGTREGPKRDLRLVCNAQSGDKIAIFGSMQNRKNIDAVLNAGIPCTINCKTRPPADWAASRFGHTHWIPETVTLHIVELADQ